MYPQGEAKSSNQFASDLGYGTDFAAIAEAAGLMAKDWWSLHKPMLPLHAVWRPWMQVRAHCCMFASRRSKTTAHSFHLNITLESD
jgi:hypothetical protein